MSDDLRAALEALTVYRYILPADDETTPSRIHRPFDMVKRDDVLAALAASATDEGPQMLDTPEQTHSAEYNRGWAEGNASALDACNPVIERLQTELAARPAVPEALDLEAIALKAAEIGFTYGALGRDFTFAYKNVQDMLAELKEGTSD